jgi:hypothetical protein
VRALLNRAIATLACVAALPLVECRPALRPVSDLLLHAEFSPRPPRAGSTAVTVRLTDSSGKPLTGARVALEGDMTHPGMAPVSGSTREMEPGRYNGSLTFSMAGDWVVLFHIRLADGTEVERQEKVNRVRAN